MNTALNFLLGFLVVGLATAQECPTDFFAAAGGCFGVFGGTQDILWAEARQACQDMAIASYTVDLATFDDTLHLEAVAQAYQAINTGTFPYMWVGIERVNNAWQYVDGRTIEESSNIWNVGHPHDMNMQVYLDDVTLSTGEHSWGRLYATCTSGNVLPRYMCRATPAA